MTTILNHEHIEAFKQELESEHYKKDIVRYLRGEILSISSYYPDREFVVGIRIEGKADRDAYGHSAFLNFFWHDCKGTYFDSRGFKVGEYVRVGLNAAGILMTLERIEDAQPIRCELCGTVLA